MRYDAQSHSHRINRILWLVVCLAASAAMLIPLLAAAGTSAAPVQGQFSPRPQTAGTAVENPTDTALETVEFIIYMEQSADFSRLSLPDDKTARVALVMETLQEIAESSQKDVRDSLESLMAGGDVSSYQVLWIANAIQVSGLTSAISALEEMPGVDRIVIDNPVRYLVEENPTTAPSPVEIPWGIQRVRAPFVWEGFGIDGNGVTVAIMDSGVDWQHPNLAGGYRGNSGSGIDHPSSWFDAVEGFQEPVDPHGHGTHVAGTAVGQNDIGMAPGAEWIGVRVLNAFGYGTLGDIHTGFQWLLAPSGDPSLAPDLVNCSWGNEYAIPDFLPDVSALRTAGIIQVYASGNNGPNSGTVHSPAGYPNTLAAGASDDLDSVAWFSSRGPSLYTTQPKPTLVAPGTFVLSSRPGGGHEYRDGTSMAAPHVTGLLALLLSADGSLNEPSAASILTSTTTALDQISPSNNSGWGLIDAYAAVAAVMPTGSLEGHVTDGSHPIPFASIAITNSSGARLQFNTSDAGEFDIPLQPGEYQVEVSAFGYDQHLASSVLITDSQGTHINFQLNSLPHGFVAGSVTNSQSGESVRSIIRVLDTPVAVETDPDGQFELTLPVGVYTLTAEALGFYKQSVLLPISEDTLTAQDFTLDKAPRTLLVDSGQWYYRSQAGYYLDALDQLQLSHDTHTIRDPFEDAPDFKLLSDYEIVIWSAPEDAPELLSAGQVISDYLDSGGNLLISGQNVAEYENWLEGRLSWWYIYFGAYQTGKVTPPQTVTAVANSIFDPALFVLNESGSAGNQEAADRVTLLPRSFAKPAFHHFDGSLAGLQAGDCAPFQAVYLGFGLEGIASLQARSRIISQSLEYFDRPVKKSGVELRPVLKQDLVAPGQLVTLTFDILNQSEVITDTFAFSSDGNEWQVDFVSQTLEIGSCQFARITTTVQVPETIDRDTVDEFVVVAVSTSDPNVVSSTPVRLKTAGRILLVDDDRWYDREAAYISALEAGGYRHDYWETGSFSSGRGSPPLDLLDAYEFVLWYTGYDWFEPVNDYELGALKSYLDQGGRLFLSSQDYLDRNGTRSLTKEYFGVRSYARSVTPTLLYGEGSPGFFDVLTKPLSLDYGAYQNFSDGLVPFIEENAHIWSDSGYPAGLANRGSAWKTVFWSLPFEVLPPDTRDSAMNRIMSWLGDLSQSTIEVDDQVVSFSDSDDATRTYTLTIASWDEADESGVWITNTIPELLVIDLSSISGGAAYDAQSRELTWEGVLSGGDEHVLSYRAIVDQSAAQGSLVLNEVEIYYDRHDLQFNRAAPLWTDTAELSSSRLELYPETIRTGETITALLVVSNTTGAIGLVTATLHMPDNLEPVSGTLFASSGAFSEASRGFSWIGTVGPGQQVLISFSLSPESELKPQLLPILALVGDGASSLVLLDRIAAVDPYYSFHPIVARQE